MIFAAVLAKYAMPEWLRKALIYALVVMVVIGCAIAYKRHLIGVGVAQEAARRDAIDERNRQLFVAALAAANLKVAVSQEIIDSNVRHMTNLERKFDHEKATSAVLQSRLASGADRLRVQIARPDAGATQSFDGPGVADLGTGTGDFAYLAPHAATFIERLRSGHNEAADRLDACIAAYDAVKLASDRLGETAPQSK